MLTLEHTTHMMSLAKIDKKYHTHTDVRFWNMVPYRLRAISATAIINCNSFPVELEVGENAMGAQSRNTDINVDCKVRARCYK